MKDQDTQLSDNGDPMTTGHIGSESSLLRPFPMRSTEAQARGIVTIHYDTFSGKGVVNALLRDIARFVREIHSQPDEAPTSFIALFNEEGDTDQRTFENVLCDFLCRLHMAEGGHWNDASFPDAADDSYSLELFGTMFYIVGMHPNSSRFALRAARPTVVFKVESSSRVVRPFMDRGSERGVV